MDFTFTVDGARFSWAWNPDTHRGSLLVRNLAGGEPLVVTLEPEEALAFSAWVAQMVAVQLTPVTE